ncbi:carbonic anhydrase family protein [Mucisphaera sp.]|uniref:carbonic anhydrase family protein n=1 Tax=Mucisphaera sp. TaxID=2913024 RepID=UPI003D12AA25
MYKAFLTAALALTLLAGCQSLHKSSQVDTVMTEDRQDDLIPAQAYQQLKAGNARFVAGQSTAFDYLAQAEATADGQYPKAFVLSCIDSRAPVETIFDQGLGDLFVARVAGNIENTDILGSMEFATAVAGTPLVVVLGHTACGGVKGTIADVELGNLTSLLHEIKPALNQADPTDGPKTADNTDYVHAVTKANVRQTMSDIVSRSEVVRDLINDGDLMIVGGVYDIANGEILWLN